MEDIRVRGEVCKIDIQRVPYARHLKSKKHLEFTAQSNVIIPRKNRKKKSCKRRFESI